MINIPYLRIRNSKTIALFSTIAPELISLIPALRKAYWLYFSNKGSPVAVIPLNTSAPGTVSLEQVEALSGLYRTTYKKLKENHRELDWAYDLRNDSSLPCCPMCGNMGRNALDHYLAKADYPEFAVLSFNLVPTCTSCNSKRGNFANAPMCSLPLFHPYFEGEKLSTPLVIVAIDEDVTPSVSPTYVMPSFRLVPLASPDHPVFARLENHLSRCVDDDQLRRWISGRWRVWRAKAPAFDSLIELRKAVKLELDAEVEVGGANNWTAAFLRGLLACSPSLVWMMDNPL